MNGPAARLGRLEVILGGRRCGCGTDLTRLVRHVPPERADEVGARLAAGGYAVEHCEACGRRLPPPVYYSVALDRV